MTRPMERTEAKARGALDGIRVCDFSWVGAGPRATKELADHGAEVIKIESALRPDPARRAPPFVNGTGLDSSAFFVMSNTSKKSVALNLSDSRGVDIARRIALESDMVVENFGKGYLDRIGLGWPDLSTERPDLVMVSVSIAGRTGPLSDFRGYGNSAAATSAQAFLTGFPDGPPHLTNYAFGDVATPLFAAVAMMGALEYRRRTGNGIYVDVSQLESMVQLLSPAFLAEAAGIPQTAIGNRSSWSAPNGVFRCLGEDAWVAVSIETDAHWAAFLHLAGIEGDPNLETVEGRLSRPKDAEDCIAKWTSARTRGEAADLLLASGIPAAPVQNGKEVSEDPQLLHRKIAEVREHPVIGDIRHVAPAFTLSRTPSSVSVAPCLGQDTDDLLSHLLGISEEERRQLYSEGVLR